MQKICRIVKPFRRQSRIADSSSRNAVNFSSARTTKRLPSSRCASTIQIVRPWESKGSIGTKRDVFVSPRNSATNSWQSIGNSCSRLQSLRSPTHTVWVLIPSDLRMTPCGSWPYSRQLWLWWALIAWPPRCASDARRA